VWYGTDASAAGHNRENKMEKLSLKTEAVSALRNFRKTHEELNIPTIVSRADQRKKMIAKAGIPPRAFSINIFNATRIVIEQSAELGLAKLEAMPFIPKTDLKVPRRKFSGYDAVDLFSKRIGRRFIAAGNITEDGRLPEELKGRLVLAEKQAEEVLFPERAPRVTAHTRIMNVKRRNIQRRNMLNAIEC
jgi:hypothetical protein